MRGLLFALVAAGALAGCGDDARPASPRDGAPAADAALVDAGPDASPVDAGPDAGPARLTGCLDQAGPPRAPAGQLPCELVPPGVTL